MRNNREYQICLAVSRYVKLRYPSVIFHFDYAGLNLSKAQSGQMKAIQMIKGFPDLFIAEPKGRYKGLFIELKPEGTRLQKVNGDSATTHLAEQNECMSRLSERGYKAVFGCGFDECKKIIDEYLNG